MLPGCLLACAHPAPFCDLYSSAAFIFAKTIVLLIMVPLVASTLCLITYSLAGNRLSAANAFLTVAMLNVLRFPLNGLGQAASSGVQTWVAMKRLTRFLLRRPSGGAKPPTVEEAANHRTQHHARVRQPSDADQQLPLVNVLECRMAWMPDEAAAATPGAFVLHADAFHVKRGEIVAIVGGVGSGKSTLLHGLLGEITLQPPARARPRASTDALVTVRGSLAYVAQQAFVVNATVKDNILFGLEYDDVWYRKVIDGCCLAADLETFTSGDETFVGETGAWREVSRVLFVCACQPTGHSLLLSFAQALPCQGGKSSGSAWPVPCTPVLTSCCSTTRCLHWMPIPARKSSKRCSGPVAC